MTLANTVLGAGYSVDLSNSPFVVPPLYAFAWGVLSDLGTAAKYLLTVTYDEVEADLP